MPTQKLTFMSDRDARLKGTAEAEAWMRENVHQNGKRRRLAQSEARLAEVAHQKAKEFEEVGETSLAAEQRLLAAFRQAKADRLASLSLADIRGGQVDQNQPRRRRKMSWSDFVATRGQLMLPFLTMVGVLVLGSTFGAPLWLTLIGAGAAARIVAMRRRAGPWMCRFWGILPTVPMLLGYTWIFWAAVVVHVLIWPHPTERPDGQSGQGGQQPPRRI